ncbi:hypothetical protein [Moritella viscosa]|uniref:Uncharacterized protein n=1 Tax=Moritella viscosa TaxID=80854 RepID=A0ABY1HD63_9GAMM|nr:hypothetical protein [Moritella viscosa]SGY87730.1 Putative uncharacterized protein [Moritella viscosa]SGY90932.1 Putative uncharacterized protein [Moritella viscosa]SGY94367.1 Putative uncharacterized protein [Moritella viscosa]SHO25436.1 Putative uncharacterized protein [Moritella viscosa]
MRYYTPLYLISLLCNAPVVMAGADTPVVMAGAETTVVLDGNKAIYEGDIGEEANATLFELYRKNKQVNTLKIKSKGGEINVGMDLAEFVYTNKLNVEVNDYCFSSCANYVFPSGMKKIIGKNAIIGFHGGASSTEFDDSELDTLPEEERKAILVFMAEYLQHALKREALFFSMIGVEQKITTLGQNEAFSKFDEADFKGWYYSIDALTKLGVTNISVIDAPWEYKPFDNVTKLFEIIANDF